jgi:hypothetical protein
LALYNYEIYGGELFNLVLRVSKLAFDEEILILGKRDM